MPLLDYSLDVIWVTKIGISARVVRNPAPRAEEEDGSGRTGKVLLEGLHTRGRAVFVAPDHGVLDRG